MTHEERFAIVLSKNRLARTIKELYWDKSEMAPGVVKYDFDEIEKLLGETHQPTGREILESDVYI